ncbi:pyridoxamine 5'-phosphate oxidase family protein [Nocardia sp. 004]|uniref:pyridoxamine 5'-phosphate oxidase family protein n=1 Tax=Nocardia sp. 004 TaxID=3385978 RepID=UPI00399FA1E6
MIDSPACRDTVALDRVESMRLLASVPIGRVVFTSNALPAVRPVTHLVDDHGAIIVRTRLSSGLTTAVRGNSPMVLAYEADEIDPVQHLGWSVVVVGLAHTVTDPRRIAHYEQLLRPWACREPDAVIAIEPDLVTGIRLVENGR